MHLKAKRSLHFGKKGDATAETMGETARKFKRAFAVTPTKVQVPLVDPFANTGPAETLIWYQSRYYRANLHFKGDFSYHLDITVYSDHYAQPCLNAATRLEYLEQRVPSILDGTHWRTDAHARTEPGAGGFFISNGKRLRKTGKVVVKEAGKRMTVAVPIVAVPIEGDKGLRF